MLSGGATRESAMKTALRELGMPAMPGRALEILMSFEPAALSCGWKLPMGSSIVALASRRIHADRIHP